MRHLLTAAILFSAPAFAQTTCLNFPAGLIPFSSIAYVTAANSAGDRLVVGALANGMNTLAQLPGPTGTNQLFCESPIQLATQQFYPSVYVPTAAERSGNFAAFAGLIVNPTTGVAYPGGIIPGNQLGAVFAFRIGPVQPGDASRNWSPTGSMASFRAFHAAVLLPSGKVLVVGGDLGTTAELYDPATGTFAQTGRTRVAHGGDVTATLLNDGRVLIAGGSLAPTSAELYDPASGLFSAPAALTDQRSGHTATRLADGRVLVIGGGQASLGNQTAEIYDPRSGAFTPTAAMSAIRGAHTATLLADGRVLITGGGRNLFATATAEVFDPAAQRFSPVASMQATRENHNAVLLPNRKVMVAGGRPGFSTAVEIFDPATNTFSSSGELSERRFFSTGTLLANGQVLLAGGQIPNGLTTSVKSVELYIPLAGLAVSTGSMGSPRNGHTATLLLDGRVLVTGGSNAGLLRTAELYTPVSQGLVTSQTGLTFRAAKGSGALPSQIVAALSSADTIPFNVSVKTFTGGGWLRATPSSGTSGPGVAPVNLTITADATGLAAQDYYGSVTLTPTDGKHPPVSIAVVLTIIPAGAAAAPGVTPTGLVFSALTGTSPRAQTLAISNLTSRALTFTSVATQTPVFFDFTPKTGTIAAGQSQTVTVTPSSASLAANVYRGSIKFNFGDGSTQTVDVLLVASATAGTSAGLAFSARAATCSPEKLLPVLTSIGAGFSTPLAWPTPVIVQVVDDCGTAINSGTVTASFTNGDPPLSLLAIGNGTWSASWVPVRPTTSTGVRADAQSLALAGSVQVNGGVAANPKVPVVASGGVLSSGDYLGSPAQGLLASIFGLALADGALGNSSLPLPQQLGSTVVLVSGVSVPVLYVSENQVNVFIPYELAVNSPHQLIVQRANAISVPVPIAIFENQPAILATAGNGAGQGHVYRINSAGAQILADASAPAKAGDVLVIYTVGLGLVNPPLKSGDPAPLTFLEPITGTAAVTIGGVPAKVEFSGLTPGFSGLYQVNVTVPAGITPGNQVPVTVSVNGRAGAGNIFMAIQN